LLAATDGMGYDRAGRGALEMLAENLVTLRKANGLSQEELAIRLNVVRQTISKWEKGLSVPDADLLIRLADIFDVPVSELLGVKIEREQEINAVAEQLSRINEQLAIKNRRARRVLKIIAIVFITFIAMYVILIITSVVSIKNFKSEALSLNDTAIIMTADTDAVNTPQDE
jgi:putative transcriptional regulator